MILFRPNLTVHTDYTTFEYAFQAIQAIIPDLVVYCIDKYLPVTETVTPPYRI